jgi:tetratricopeptide (TPR) repeat protein
MKGPQNMMSMKWGWACAAAALLGMAWLGTGCRTTPKGLKLEQRQSMAQADFQRAVRLVHAGKPDRAMSALQSGLDLDPENLACRLFLAGLLQENGNTTAALQQYDVALKTVRKTDTNTTDRIMIYGNRGDCFLSMRRFAEAEADFSRALELQPQEPAMMQFKRGEARMGLKRYDEALADLTAVAQARPHEAWPWMRRGDCLFAMTNLIAAADDYTVALERTPKDSALFARRAAVYGALDQEEMALADYTRALDLEPENARRWYDRAVSRLQLDQTKEAIADFTEALKREPKRPEILVARGMARELAGDDSQALADYALAQAVAPDYKPAAENRKRLLDRAAAKR